MILDRGEKIGWGWIRKMGWKDSGEHRVMIIIRGDAKQTFCKRMTRATFLILQIDRNIKIYIYIYNDNFTSIFQCIHHERWCEVHGGRVIILQKSYFLWDKIIIDKISKM